MDNIGGQGIIDKKAKLEENNILCNVPFTSKRKMGSIVVRQPEFIGTAQEVRVYTKGAPDMLYEKCEYVVGQNGSLSYFESDNCQLPSELGGDSSNYKSLFEKSVKFFADQAYRTLLLCYKDMSMNDFLQLKRDNNNFARENDRLVLENNLVAIGIFGLQDPLRDHIEESIELCRTAGISVIMCTGDNIDTAIAISKNAGIITEAQRNENQYAAMTGKQFREAVGGLTKIPNDKGEEVDKVSNMKMFKTIIKELKVLARSSPEDKYILVTGIQDSNGVVAVTGDGTNDAPALTKADVGFSMGITGTDVAQGASDIILLDDDFSSIIVALKYGRNVFDNVRCFLQFQLTVNVVAMFIVFLGAVALKDSPLNAVQMLWVNLIMDTFAALALATEPPSDAILLRKPIDKNEDIVTDVMWRFSFGHSIYQIIVLLVLIFAGQGWLSAVYDQQCMKYTSSGACDTSTYNALYTNLPYYKPAQWDKLFAGANPLTEANFDKDQLQIWRCSVFKQLNGYREGKTNPCVTKKSEFNS